MDATTIAVDLAKSVFQLAEADDQWQIVRTHRLTRRQFERFFANRSAKLVIMEACGSAHYWARWLTDLGIPVRLLPPKHVRRYVLGNKTDAADCAALLEAARNPKIRPVRVKGVEQQALQALHRLRSQWMATRTQRINGLRGFCREFGLAVPRGARVGLSAIAALVAGPGLGRVITDGFYRTQYGKGIAGAIVVALVALVLELLAAAAQRAVTPAADRRSPGRSRTTSADTPTVGA